MANAEKSMSIQSVCVCMAHVNRGSVWSVGKLKSIQGDRKGVANKVL